MATTTAMCSTFKKEILTAGHDFTTTTGSAFKIALIKVAPAGTYGAASINYTDITGNTDEASGTGYTATGIALTNVTPTLSSTTALTDFADVSWTTSTFDATAAMIYNTTLSGASVSLHDFGGTKSVSAGTFTITFPVADASNAIIRIA